MSRSSPAAARASADWTEPHPVLTASVSVIGLGAPSGGAAFEREHLVVAVALQMDAAGPTAAEPLVPAVADPEVLIPVADVPVVLTTPADALPVTAVEAAAPPVPFTHWVGPCLSQAGGYGAVSARSVDSRRGEGRVVATLDVDVLDVRARDLGDLGEAGLHQVDGHR